MDIKSEITIYPSPISASFDDVDDVAIEVFFALGIVNPHGPTLTYVAAIGEPRLGIQRTLVAVLLNPFSQTVNQVGTFTIGNDFEPGLLDPIYKFTTGACPSLILLGFNGSDAMRLHRAEMLLTTFDPSEVDLLAVRIENYFGGPGARVTADMQGEQTKARGKSGQSSVSRLAKLCNDGNHIWPEIRTFLYAWNGSINLSGIPESMKRTAFPMEKLKNHLLDRLFPTLFIPQEAATDPAPPPTHKPERYVPKNIAEVRADLQHEHWDNFSLDNLADLLRASIIMYGAEVIQGDIPHISRLYQAALNRGLDAENRLMIEGEILRVLDESRISFVAFMPFLVHDPDQQVASNAVIDFVSESPYVDGELAAIMELRTLFKGGRIANRSAVFGGMAAICDVELEPFLREVRNDLTAKEVTEAAKVHTQFLKHRSIQFWLGWCKELVGKKDEDSQKKFGGCASALSLCLRYGTEKTVVASKRNFPCTGQKEAVTKLRTWTLDEYAEFIAPDLYELEAAEEAPKLFSSVLRDWGLMPASSLTEQYIPEGSSDGGSLVRLRDLAPRIPSTNEQLLMLADSGNVSAQNRLANRFYGAMGGVQDFAKARIWYLKAATGGHAASQFNLGYMCATGEGGQISDDEAIHWYGLAAKQGLSVAMNNLATVLERLDRLEEAVHWYRQAAYEGSVSAQGSLGFAYSNGRGVEASPEKAAAFYRLAAANGSAAAEFNLSVLFSSGKGVKQDHVAAAYWVTLAANQGYHPAQKRLADLYKAGEGVEPSEELSAQWNLKAAIQGNTDAQNTLAIHYVTGAGLSKDEFIAYMWLATAASLGNSDAQGNLARVQVDRSSDACKLVEAAVAGDVESQGQLSYKLKMGDGVPKEDDASLYWLGRSAKGGHPWAQTTLANVIADGGVDPNGEGARFWLMAAVKNGYPDALRQLGIWQVTGRGGCQVDIGQSVKYLIQASLLGAHVAKDAFDRIREAIPSEAWPEIFGWIAWPTLVFLMGPLAPGNFDEVRLSYEQDDGTDTAKWFMFERQEAATFLASGKEGHAGMFEPIFGEQVRLEKFDVQREIVDGKPYAAVRVNLFHLKVDDGFPVYWLPKHEELKAVNGLLAVLCGREWVRSKIEFFPSS